MHPDVVDQNPTIPQFLLWKASKVIGRKKANARTHTRTWVLTTIRLVMQLAGFGSLTVAGFTWNMIAGYVVAGLSCFLLSWLTTSDPEKSQNGNSPGPGYQR
jgi:hypothetical protein